MVAGLKVGLQLIGTDAFKVFYLFCFFKLWVSAGWFFFIFYGVFYLFSFFLTLGFSGLALSSGTLFPTAQVSQ